jgi:hypothetical protein
VRKTGWLGVRPAVALDLLGEPVRPSLVKHVSVIWPLALMCGFAVRGLFDSVGNSTLLLSTAFRQTIAEPASVLVPVVLLAWAVLRYLNGLHTKNYAARVTAAPWALVALGALVGHPLVVHTLG